MSGEETPEPRRGGALASSGAASEPSVANLTLRQSAPEQRDDADGPSTEPGAGGTGSGQQATAAAPKPTGSAAGSASETAGAATGAPGVATEAPATAGKTAGAAGKTAGAAEKTAGAAGKTTDRAGAGDAAGTKSESDSGGKGDEAGWSRFAPVEPNPPGLLRRIGGGVGRFCSHEWTVASVAGLLLAVLMTWPTVLHPASTIPQDIYDPLLQTWQVAWDGHALLTDPLHLWDSNTFFPDHDTLAFSDSLLGYAPLGMIGSGPVAALVRYNILYVLAYALAFVGMYALCRQLGTRKPGAAMAAAAFAYAPWRLAHGGHLNILSTGGIALALAMLARGHGFSFRRDGKPGRVRWGWALGGWLVAAWQVTLGWGLGLPFCYLLGVLVAVGCVVWLVRRIRRRLRKDTGRAGRFHLSLLLGNLVGLAVFGATCLYLGLPYLRAVHEHPEARRTVAELKLFSPPWQGFFIAPEQSWLWGDTHAQARQALPFQPEMTLLVGMVLVAFAVLGLFLSSWRIRTRLLLLAGVAVSVVLAMGTAFPGGGRYTYLVLYDHLPAWDAIRTPGRLVLWTTLLLALLAAGAVNALSQRADEFAVSRGRNPRRVGPALRLLVAVPLVLVLIEGWARTPHPQVPTEPREMHALAGPVLILPTDTLTDQRYMYWSTDGFPQLVNGGSGVQPAKQDQIRQAATDFPSQRSVDYLRQLGVRTVVVFRDGLAGTPYQNVISKSTIGLGVKLHDTGPAVVYVLDPA